MRLSACITVNDRSPDVLARVFASMRDQAFDEFVIVLDEPPAATLAFANEYDWGTRAGAVKRVIVRRAPGWRSPVKAWNAGYAAVTGDTLYCFSSETVQAPGNLARAHEMLAADPQQVIFGRAECSCGPEGREVNWGGQAPGNLLCDAAHPRPLGFIWAAPMAPVRAIGGWDEAYDAGYWFDEADFFVRLWRTGLDFTFTDAISGTHLHHERLVLDTPAGAAGIAHNRAYTLQKHGSLDPLAGSPKIVERRAAWTQWRHL